MGLSEQYFKGKNYFPKNQIFQNNFKKSFRKFGGFKRKSYLYISQLR